MILFREGNGSVARLLASLMANLMALQTLRNLLNYAPIDKTTYQQKYDNHIVGFIEVLKVRMAFVILKIIERVLGCCVVN